MMCLESTTGALEAKDADKGSEETVDAPGARLMLVRG